MSDKPTPQQLLATLEEQIAWYQKTRPTNGGSYSRSITNIPKPIREGIFFYGQGWGWRLRKDWEAVLEKRRVELAAGDATP